MIYHTMLVSFSQPISTDDLAAYVADIEAPMAHSGLVRSFSSQRHIAVEGEEHIPAFIATAVIQLGVDDRDALSQLFAAPGIEQVIDTWQARNPYQVAWVNHEPLS
jgi:hypothetical protein